MAKIVFDYTAEETEQQIANNRDFLLEHNENILCIEIPKGLLNAKLKKSDGVLIADNHEVELRNYLHIIAENKNGNHVLALLRVSGDMSGTGVRGMKGSQIGALKGIIKKNLINIDDPKTDDYKNEDGDWIPYNAPIDFSSMTWTELKDWIRENDNPDNYDLRSESKTRDALAEEYK